MREVLEVAAAGHRPTHADLDQVESVTTRATRDAVAAAAERVVRVRLAGLHRAARREAAAFTDELVGDDSDWVPSGVDSDDPAALAAEVRGDGATAAAVREDVARLRR